MTRPRKTSIFSTRPRAGSKGIGESLTSDIPSACHKDRGGRQHFRIICLPRRVGCAREKVQTDRFMKILVDAETKMASLMGIEGDGVIHSILDVMYANAPYKVIQRAMHIHPTVSELIPTMLGELKPLE